MRSSKWQTNESSGPFFIGPIYPNFALHTLSFNSRVAAILSRAEELREGADYDVALNVELQAVSDLVGDVERFVHAVEAIIT